MLCSADLAERVGPLAFDGRAVHLSLLLAAYGAGRPDVAAIFGGRFTNSGFSLTTSGGLAPGAYTLVVFVHSTASGTFSAQTRDITIRAGNPNSAFGVASFADYQERMPWRLDRDITEDIDSVATAITRLRLYDGKDFAEAYSRALYEARFVGWRPGARRIIILFGDAPAHDPNFYGQSTGIDPV